MERGYLEEMSFIYSFCLKDLPEFLKGLRRAQAEFQFEAL